MEKKRVFLDILAEDVTVLQETLDLVQDYLVEVSDETGADIVVRFDSDDDDAYTDDDVGP